MRRWLSAGIFALVVLLAAGLLAAVVPAAADTGTYEIPDYTVTLEPQNNGDVKITYEQTWKVLSGDIPWITVGLANEQYSILDHSGNAAKVSPDNGGGFTGVRIDLDRDYQPGQTFNVKFAVMQSNILERLTDQKEWRIDFTPGWYDQAKIDHMAITLISPVVPESYTQLSPTPSTINGSVITWSAANLSPGARFNVVMMSTDGSFLTAPAPVSSSTSTSWGTGFWSPTIFIIIGVILFVGLIVWWGIRQNRKARDEELKKRVEAYEKEMAEDPKKKAEFEQGFEEYVDKKGIKADAEGRYYDRSYGNYITPAVWAAIVYTQMNRDQGQGAPPPSGHHPSCACACVSCACACACACAGGGAAGCARKTLHECKECGKGENTTKPPKGGLQIEK
jgi:membrane protein implicated in regulation of membrane protease activity